MVSQQATLSERLEVKLAELREAAGGADEAAAGRRPSDGEWSVKEILSHLMGEEGQDFMGTLRRIRAEDNPLIGIVARIPFYGPEREKMTADQLLDAVLAQYSDISRFLAGLGPEELARPARIPLLADTPIGENATMGQWATAIIEFHVPDHIEQIRTVRRALGA